MTQRIHPSQWRLVLVAKNWSKAELEVLAMRMACECARLSEELSRLRRGGD